MVAADSRDIEPENITILISVHLYRITMKYSVVVLLSAGIDSPVAAHMLAESGAHVTLLHMDTRPFTDDRTMENVRSLVKKLREYHPEMAGYSAGFGEMEKAIAQNANPRYQCILCKRNMYRAASKFAIEIGADAIATGESLGQVASQTLSNLVEEDAAVDIPVHRPLIGLDKNDVIEIGREIGTYELSIQPAVCCMLTPKGPKLSCKKDDVLKEEDKLDWGGLIEDLVFEPIGEG